MTEEAQQKAIAEACGKAVSCAPDPYNDTPDLHDFGDWKTQYKPFPFRFRQCNKCPAFHIEGERFVSIDTDKVAPDYLNNLNAMAEAEKTLSEDEYDNYGQHLMKVTGVSTFSVQDCRKMLSATAAQRAEAFVRVKGLWVD